MSERIPSPLEVESHKTPAGGWTRATLAAWGVPWPPKQGWRLELEHKWREQQNAEFAVHRMKEPAFYCSRSLLSYHPDQDLNRVILHGPGGFSFVLLRIGAARSAEIDVDMTRLAHELSKLWEKKT